MKTSRSTNKPSTQIQTYVNKQLTVFVTGLCGLIKKEDLESFFNLQCGGSVSIVLPDKKSAGHAFVEMDSPETLQRILKLKNLTFNGREIQIKPYVEGKDLKRFKDEINSRRVFVSRIPKNWSDKFFQEIFSSFGKIETAYIIRNRKSKKSKGFGYIVYESKETALKITSLNKLTIDDSTLLLKMHEPRHKQLLKKGSNACTKDQENNIWKDSKRDIEESPKKKSEKVNYDESFHWIKPTQAQFCLRRQNFQAYSRPEEYDLTFEATARAYERREKFLNIKLKFSATHGFYSLNFKKRNSLRSTFALHQRAEC